MSIGTELSIGQRAKLKEIDRRYKKRGRRNRRRPSITELRLSELNRIALYYWPNRELPNDEDGRDHARVVVNHLAECRNPEKRIDAWVEQWARAFDEDEDFEDFEEMVERALDNPTHYSADSVAIAIWLDFETRQLLQIRTIGAYDKLLPEREKLRLQKQALRQARIRAAAGATPRVQSASRTKPWDELGISRSKFYHNRRRNNQ